MAPSALTALTDEDKFLFDLRGFLSLQHMPRDVARFERQTDWVVQPAMDAGDVLIFTEALSHGTAVWPADHERRTRLYKYSPPHSTWVKTPYDPADFPHATPRQRRLMAPPTVEAHARVIGDDPDRPG